MEEQGLLEAVGAGDRAAFTALYRNCRPMMLAYSTAILGGDSAAGEDAVDEAFADIWRLASKYQAVGSASAWIRRIVRNKSIDLLRKNGGRETLRSADFFADFQDQAPDPEESALLSDERRWLRGALAILSTDQREVITMCYFEGLSMQQISDALDTPVNTVKTRLHYARRKLLTWIEAESEDTNFTHLTANMGQSALAV